MIPREKILEAHPIAVFLAKRGLQIKQAGGELKCCCPFHDDKTPSMSINETKGVWYCFVCGFGGTVIDYVIRKEGIGCKEALTLLADEAGLKDDGKPVVAARYVYKDSYGRDKMVVDRIEEGNKKRFVQQHTNCDGKLVPNLDGVQRVLFRMERWAGKPEVALVEGEKCVAAMESIGIDATCNPGGSNGWMTSYAEYLKGKHVDIWPDNDEPGNKWLERVLASLEGKVASLRILRVPSIYNDVADVIIAQGEELGAKTLMCVMEKASRITRGVIMPLLSSEECYDRYKQRIAAYDEHAVDLGKWLPSFRHHARPLLPGDLAVILADTGVGKTCVLNNIAKSQRPLTCIFFQFELSPEPMCERFIAMSHEDVTTLEVERRTKRGETFDVSGWDHIFLCPESSMSIEQVEGIVMQSELKTGTKPRVVCVDYIGLMGGVNDRYERMSDVAEGLKQMARRTDTVVIAASQLKRDDKRTEVFLHDGKGSGSIENSAQLVIGAWRDSPTDITLKILKQTKKSGQPTIKALFDGDHQCIKEKAIHHEWAPGE